MRARRQATEKRIAWLKSYLLQSMQACEITEISCPEFAIRIARNPCAVVISDESQLPQDYMVEKISYAPDKQAIREALRQGEEIPGARIEQRSRLVVR